MKSFDVEMFVKSRCTLEVIVGDAFERDAVHSTEFSVHPAFCHASNRGEKYFVPVEGRT